MSGALATRCPACSTVFRVVPDQLRVSEGWVRCGRCSDVFDATLSLVDLDTGAPQTLDGTRPRRAAPPPGVAAGGSTGAAGEAAAAPLRIVVPPQEPAAAASGIDRGAVLAAPTPSFEPASESQAEPASAAAPAAAAEPSFVRRAQRAERWQRPGVRAALAAASLAALAALAVQFAIAYRDLVAARYPAARPALERACGWLGCRVEAARMIDGLAVDSSGLLRIERSDLYRLSVALRNLAGIELALPALDLALTDARGRLIARRVLQPAELGAPASTLAAGGELALQATLRAELPEGAPVAGYTIELFYP